MSGIGGIGGPGGITPQEDPEKKDTPLEAKQLQSPSQLKAERKNVKQTEEIKTLDLQNNETKMTCISGQINSGQIVKALFENPSSLTEDSVKLQAGSAQASLISSLLERK